MALGAATAALAPSALLKIAFALIAASIAAKLLLGAREWTLAARLPSGNLMRAYGFLVGLASSLMGVSGGSLATLVLTLYGVPIHNAVATSAGIGIPITVAGTIGYILAGLPHQALLPPFSFGFVSLSGAALMAPLAALIAPLGAELAHALPKRHLEIGLGLFLLAASARFMVSLLAA